MRRWLIFAIRCAVVCIAIGAVDLGLKVRKEAWTFTQGGHFKGDVRNAFNWGRITSAYGLFHLYQEDEAANVPGTIIRIPRPELRSLPFQLPGRKTDYTPLRLAIAEAYASWVQRTFPDVTVWQDTYEFNWPLLWTNTSAELAAAILVFLIIWKWRSHCEIAESGTGLAKLFMAMFGALLIWFNPAVIWDGHCWPQWDIWPVPFFLAAVLLALTESWLLAGMCLAIGASLKGQMLLGAPVLLIYPVFRGQFGRAFRLVSGFMVMAAAIVLPWMLPGTGAVRWLILIIVAMAVASIVSTKWKVRPQWIGMALIIPAALLAWPFGCAAGGLSWEILVLLMLTVCGCIRFIPRWYWLPTFAMLVGISILLMMPLFDASSSWYRLGFKYGTEKFGAMVTGSGAYNLPRMLMVYVNWPEETTDPVAIPLIGTTLTFTQLTRAVYGLCLLICGIGASMHHRRRDPRFLVAIAAPWLLFFMILTQMHGRYTIWAAAIGALLAGAETGVALLGVIVSIVSCAGIMENQLLFSPRWSPQTLRILQALDPGVGFALLLIALIYVYYSIVPGTRRAVCESSLLP